jgi:uncharacterized protein (DUF58 family)
MNIIKGISCNIQELLREALQVKQTLHIKRSPKALLSGAQRASVRGRGMEFFESRPYVAQDEIRNIDWKVSARLNSVFTKVFIEERNRPFILFIDFRSHMYFGTKNHFKSLLAAKLAARLAQAALNGGDPVGALLSSDQRLDESPLSLHKKNFARLLGILALYTQNFTEKKHDSDSSYWPSRLSRLYNFAHRGSALFLLSDFLGLDASAHHWLYRLRKRSDVVALSLHDPLEERIPPLGLLKMSYEGLSATFNSSDKKFAASYERHYQEQRQLKDELFLSLDIPHIHISTADNLDEGFLKLVKGQW